MTEAETPTPVSAEATGMGFHPDAPTPQADPSFVNGHALAMLAHNLPQIVWTFSEDDKAYFGSASYGKFDMRRSDTGRIFVDYTSACETHTARMYMDQTAVSAAKAAVLLRLLDSLNQSRRLGLIVPEAVTADEVIPDEPDLI